MEQVRHVGQSHSSARKGGRLLSRSRIGPGARAARSGIYLSLQKNFRVSNPMLYAQLAQRDEGANFFPQIEESGSPADPLDQPGRTRALRWLPSLTVAAQAGFHLIVPPLRLNNCQGRSQENFVANNNGTNFENERHRIGATERSSADHGSLHLGGCSGASLWPGQGSAPRNEPR